MAKKVAVVLCGSGFKDGSEIRESVAALHAIEKHGSTFDCFSPNDFQADVVNCRTLQIMPNEKRNMLVESARIARSQVEDLKTLNVKNYDVLVFPGGFGAAKNFCTFATQGSKATVRADLQNVIDDFYREQKTIVAICISPVVLALALKDQQLHLTLGADGEAAQEIEKLGHFHMPTQNATEFVKDPTHRIFTTPAYMFDKARITDVFAGIDNCLAEALKDTF